MARARTIANLWRDAVAGRAPDPAYLHEVDGEWRRGHAGRRPRAPSTSSRTACSRSASSKGDAFAMLGAHEPRVGAVRLRARARRRRRRADLRRQLGARHALRARALGGGRRARRGRRAAREGRRASAGHVISFAELDALRERGRAYAAEHPGALDERADSIDEDDLFTFIYTSGTTGPPKACMIRHRNYYAMVQKGDEMDERLTEPGDVMLLYLPLAHNYGRLLHLVGGVRRLHDRVPARPAARRRPSCRACGRRSSRACRASTRRSTPPSSRSSTRRPARKRKLIDWALAVGRRVSRLRQAKQPVPRALRAQHRLADRLVYSKVKARLGGRLRVANAGGAPLAREIAEFFHALDILDPRGLRPLRGDDRRDREPPERLQFGTVGKPLPGVEVRIADDGEILSARTPSSPATTTTRRRPREVLDDDGFVHTGDVGHLDEDGFLVITDRKKDIIVTAGGKNVAPQNLENELKSHRGRLAGDRRRRPQAVHRRADHARPGRRRTRGRRCTAAVQSAVDAVNAERSRFEQIKRFAVLPRDFTARGGRDDADAEADAARCPGALRRRDRRAVRVVGARGCGGRRRTWPRTSLVEAGDLHDVAGVRRVDELAAADVDADVAEAVEEDEVARLQLVAARPARRSRTARTTSAAARRRPARRRTSRGPSSRSRPARPAPDVRRAELPHRDADDAAVGRRRRDDRRRRRRRRETPTTVVGACACARRCCCARAAPGPRARAARWRAASRRSSRAISPLIEESSAAARASCDSIDASRAARSATTSLPAGRARSRAVVAALAPPCGTCFTCADDLRVQLRDAVRGVDPVDHVVEALRAEDHLERRGLSRRVERHEPLRDRALARLQVAAWRCAARAVLAQVALDLRELDVREVVLRPRSSSESESSDLTHDLLRLGLLRRDRGVGKRRDCGQKSRRRSRRERTAPSQPTITTPGSGTGRAHREGPVRHE